MSIKVAIIGTNGLPGNYGGWDQLIKHQTNNLRGKFNFFVYTSYANAVPGLKEYNGAKLIKLPLKANGFQSIPYDIISLLHASTFCDVLFICGTSGCISLPIVRLFNKKIILNPDGLEWKRGKWSPIIKWFLKLSTKLGVQFSDVVVADNKIIQEFILEEYKKESVLIEYGGDQVLHIPLSAETEKKYQIKNQKYAFKVCRIEPENNLDMIIEAFAEIPTIDLVIVGNWDFSNYGKELRKRYSQFKHLKLLNPIYDQKVLDELRSNCALYVHGHSVGGTNPSLVEAMNLGLCVIAYNVPYNVETTEASAIYFETRADLIKILNEYQKDLIDLNIYRVKMKSIANRRYKWDTITEKYASLFTKK